MDFDRVENRCAAVRICRFTDARSPIYSFYNKAQADTLRNRHHHLFAFCKYSLHIQATSTRHDNQADKLRLQLP